MPSASEEVASQLRARIVGGRWQPGTRLPDRPALAKELGACAATLQKAVAQVADEGFLTVASRRQGTFVAAFPPHLCRYRLIFPYGPGDWGEFWHALEQAAAGRTAPAREYVCFYGLGGHRDIASFQAVVDEVRSQRVAGLIFASSAAEFAGTPLLEAPTVPRAALATGDQLPGVPKVSTDLDHFIERAVATLADRGRRRLALLCASRAPQLVHPFRAALAARGLSSRRIWEQFASMRNQEAARNAMALVFHAGQDERPDGLIIADDNLVTSATRGLTDAGVTVGRDLEVVAMTNFPNLLPALVPVIRLGFDITAVLDLLTARLEESIAGRTPPEVTNVPAITETEYRRPPPPVEEPGSYLRDQRPEPPATPPRLPESTKKELLT